MACGSCSPQNYINEWLLRVVWILWSRMPLWSHVRLSHLDRVKIEDYGSPRILKSAVSELLLSLDGQSPGSYASTATTQSLWVMYNLWSRTVLWSCTALWSRETQFSPPHEDWGLFKPASFHLGAPVQRFWKSGGTPQLRATWVLQPCYPLWPCPPFKCVVTPKL